MNRSFLDRMRRVVVLAVVSASLLLLPVSLRADSPQAKPLALNPSQPMPDAADVMRQMKEVMEPQGPSLRRVLFTVKNPSAYTEGYETIEKVAGVAIKNFPDGKRMVLTMLSPDDVKGTAYLIEERKAGDDAMYSYLPAIRRVREIKWVDQYQDFLGTDFTYADLGFMKLHGHYTYLGEEKRNGVPAYAIQENIPQELLYYSKIITWVGVDSKLPVERDFYDPAGQLLKQELFQTISVVDGVPTALRIKMTDVEQQTSTELDIRNVEYSAPLPNEIFDPKHLSTVSSAEIWKLCMCGPDQGKQ